jgi:hypothetical protein
MTASPLSLIEDLSIYCKTAVELMLASAVTRATETEYGCRVIVTELPLTSREVSADNVNVPVVNS